MKATIVENCKTLLLAYIRGQVLYDQGVWYWQWSYDEGSGYWYAPREVLTTMALVKSRCRRASFMIG